MTSNKYQDAIEYLYSQLPMFSRVGAAAYKPGLERTIALDNTFGNPHKKFKSIHIAGTNGKGSTSHLLASILMANGYKTALYTSPHLVDFRERIKINGEMIPEEKVVEFVERWKNISKTADIHPSFFELTMIMAFDWFAQENVDFAVIETGMGGRLDSTNIITPILTAITNISPDHMQFLGDTLEKIAIEKAGIIKPGIPIVIGEAKDGIRDVFQNRSRDVNAPIIEAFATPEIKSIKRNKNWGWDCTTIGNNSFTLPLGGDYQKKNINTVLHIVKALRGAGVKLSNKNIAEGIQNVVNYTGLMGRWMKVADNPLTICDTGHNEDGIRYISTQLETIIAEKRADGLKPTLRMVIGFVADKDVEHILSLLPKEAKYYITQASIPRAMNSEELSKRAKSAGLNVVEVIGEVKEAVAKATADATADDLLFIGGSTFVVADFLS